MAMKDSPLESCNACHTEHIVSPPELRIAFFADIALAACPFCKSAHIDVLAVEIDLYAALCRACGAHGPVRVLGPKQYVDCVKAQAAHDWNQAATTMTLRYIAVERECPEGPAAASPVEGQAHDKKPGEAVSTEAPGTYNPPTGASVEQSTNKAGGEPRAEDRKPDNGGEAVTSTLATDGPPTAPETMCTRLPADSQGQCKEAPDGGGAGVQRVGGYQLELGDRLAKFLGELDMTPEKAIAKGMKFGVSKATLYNILKGQKVSVKSLAALAKALKKMERSRKLSGAAQQKPATKPSTSVTTTETKGVRVEVLGNNFREATGVNRCPVPVAPPRCGRTP